MKHLKMITTLLLLMSSQSLFAQDDTQKLSNTLVVNYIKNVQARLDYIEQMQGCFQGRMMADNIADIESAHGQLSYEGVYYPTEVTETAFKSINPELNPKVPEFVNENMAYKVSLNRTLEKYNYELPDPKQEINLEAIRLLNGSKFISDMMESPAGLPYTIQFLDNGKISYLELEEETARTGSYTVKYVRDDENTVHLAISITTLKGEFELELISQQNFYYRTELVLRLKGSDQETFGSFYAECME